MELNIILGDQLFPTAMQKGPKVVFMAESMDLCRRHRFHKQKIYHTLAAMRQYRAELEAKGYQVFYNKLEDHGDEEFIVLLLKRVKQSKVKSLSLFRPADAFMSQVLTDFSQRHGLSLEMRPNPMFLRQPAWFSQYMAGRKKPFMKTFYEALRRETGLLMVDGEPVGGKFSFDKENRQRLPEDLATPVVKMPQASSTDLEVAALVTSTFSDHPGSLETLWLPTSRKQALARLRSFIRHNLEEFGPYQDAIDRKNGFLFHSLLSPSLNVGHLLPMEVLEAAITAFEAKKAPLASVEGFVRQILGWREFVRFVYDAYPQRLYESNHFDHRRQLKPSWYEGTTGLPPLDTAIKHAVTYGYCHHIDRLMVVANLMNLCEIEPMAAYDWFMEMFVDAADWVMAANVFGMGLMSEGGIFATKPYIAGSNYIRKMSHFEKGDWCDIWDGLYWRFVDQKREKLRGNPRLGMMLGTLDKMNPSRRERIFTQAENFLTRHTIRSRS